MTVWTFSEELEPFVLLILPETVQFSSAMEFLPLNDERFGIVRGELRVFDGNGCRGVNGRGVVPVRGIAAARDVHGSAAAVGADSRRRVAGGGDGQVFRVRRAAAGGLDAAGVISACRDRGIGDVDGRVCSIAEHAVAVLRGGIDSRVFDRDGRAVRRQQRGVHAVEVAVLRRSCRADHSAHRRAGCRPGAYPADRLRRPAAFRRKHRRMRSRLPDYQPQRPPRCCRRP